MATKNLPIITLEEHWMSQHVRNYYAAQGEPDVHDENGLMAIVTSALAEFGPKRLQAMDDAGVALQVVSHAPSHIPLPEEVCIKVNDELHGLISQAPPNRFKGFATLPMAEPKAAAAELRRCVESYGFLGTLIDSNCGGKYYDDESFWPVFQAAEELDVPIYLHPSPNENLKKVLYTGNYPDSVAESMSQYGWGWHNETAVHFLRLFAAGVFDKFPKLKLVLGHLGEMLPFQLDRIIGITSRQWPHLGVNLKRQLRQVWDENVWITTSGMFALPPMACVLKQCRPDRIMFSVDYPFGSNKAGVEFLQLLKEDGMVDDEFLRKIAYSNAEKVLGVKMGAKE